MSTKPTTSRPINEPPPPPDASGALWLTGSGASLLLAAAATFVAVRWNHLAGWEKALALVGFTQLLLGAGRLARRRLPTTAGALLTLGAVLVPLDGWTIGASGAGTWQRGLLVAGVLGVAWFPVVRRVVDNMGIRAAWIASVPLAVAGVAAATHGLVPTALTVAGVGLLAGLVGSPDDARWWLALGACAPALTFVEPILPVGRGTLMQLGLSGPSSWWVAAGVAAVAVAGSAIVARRTRRVDSMWLGASLAGVDVMSALRIEHVGAADWFLTFAVIAAAVQATALLLSTDRFWAWWSARLGFGAELASYVVAVSSLDMWRWLPHQSTTRLTVVVVDVLLVVGWVLADARTVPRAPNRRWRDALSGRQSMFRGFAVQFFLLAAVGTLPVGGAGAAIATALLATAMVVARRAGSAGLAPIALASAGLWAELLVNDGHAWAVAITMWAVTLLVVLARRADSRFVAAWTSVVTTALLVVIDFMGIWPGRGVFDGLFSTPTGGDVLIVSAIVAPLVVGTVASRRGRLPVGSILPWLLAAFAVLLTFHGSDPIVVTVAVGTVAWWAVDGWHRRSAVPVAFAVLTSAFATATLLDSIGVRGAGIGLGMALAGVACVGVSLAAAGKVRLGLYAAAASQLLAGLVMAGTSLETVGIVTTILGGLVVTVALVEAAEALAWIGAALGMIGAWTAMSAGHVGAVEAYLAPLALVTLIAGLRARHLYGVSSWLADLPAVTVLGLGSFATRLDGGSGWHAVCAGAVAVSAISIGSWRRLAGPLFGGSLLLVAVVVNETVRMTAGAPTWMWMAFGGLALLGTGVAMEAQGVGPIESGRRLVEVIDQRYS